MSDHNNTFKVGDRVVLGNGDHGVITAKSERGNFFVRPDDDGFADWYHQNDLAPRPDQMDMYALLATLQDGRLTRHEGEYDWDTAQTMWREHDDRRIVGHRPQVRCYEVRSVDDPKVKEATPPIFAPDPVVRRIAFSETLSPTGYLDGAGNFSRLLTGREKAAKKALHARQHLRPDGRVNGIGGWFYWGNRTIAQGLDGLANVAERRGWIYKLPNGRWIALTPYSSEV